MFRHQITQQSLDTSGTTAASGYLGTAAASGYLGTAAASGYPGTALIIMIVWSPRVDWTDRRISLK